MMALSTCEIASINRRAPKSLFASTMGALIWTESGTIRPLATRCVSQLMGTMQDGTVLVIDTRAELEDSTMCVRQEPLVSTRG